MHARSSTLPHRDLPVVLIIRDGWGQNPHPEQDAFNAIKLAHTPVDDRLMREWPHTLVITSGEDVGLPPGTMGNSEVGHQNIGAGRIVDQELMRITRAIRTGAFFENRAFRAAFEHAIKSGGKMHLLGLLSNGFVHSDIEHLFALIDLAKLAFMAIFIRPRLYWIPNAMPFLRLGQTIFPKSVAVKRTDWHRSETSIT